LPPEPAPTPASKEGQAPANASNLATPFLVSQRDLTQDSKVPDSGHDSSLTDFLSPPQAGDELGRLGKYRILKVLGHGGMGVVYQAEDPLLKRTVALKAMLPTLAASASAGKRFLREAQAMAAVKHDHIVTIYQVDEERSVPFLAMEFLAGEPLDQRLHREAKLPLTEVLRIGREIARALAAAHATGLIHRDIKPGNIWLEAPEDRVKILDFGLARAAAQEAGLTQQGAILGTPAYMAPEQARGDPVDARSDLFSLGVVLYRLCSGQLPFQGKDTVSTLMEVALHQPAPPIQLNGDLPQELSDLVMRLLEKNPNQRSGTADEVVQALQTLEKKWARRKEAAETTVLGPVPSKRRGQPLLVAALVLAGLIGAGTLALIRITTDQGDYVIKTDNPEFSFRVNKEGGVTLQDHKAKREYTLTVVRQGKGEFDLEATDAAADLAFKSKIFTIKRGGEVALQAWFERKPDSEKHPPIAAAWFEEVARLPADKQVAAVADKLKERNLGFEGPVTPLIEAGVVTELQFLAHHVTDLSPVCALPALRKLECPGTQERKSPLADLTPLRDVKLTHLDCSNTNVADLTPLKDMKLTLLDCGNTNVSNLAPLKGMPLTVLFCGCTQVEDLSPLQDTRVTILHCYRTRVTDLAPLKGVRLTDLDCHGTQIKTLEPLKDMKLIELDCHGTQIETLAPLKGMKLTGLNCSETQVSDLLPLQEMRLKGLWCDDTQVVDLTPLKGMRLTSLRFSSTQVSDLTPLKGMKLMELWCEGTQVEDLSPLKEMSVQELHCDFKPERDAAILRSLKTLEKINGKSVQEFLGQAPCEE